MIIDGKAIAEEIKKSLAQRANRSRILAVVQVGDDPVSTRYIGRKQAFGAAVGVEVRLYQFEESITETDLAGEITRLGIDAMIDGIIVQLPLPTHIDLEHIVTLVPPHKDIDALGSEARVLSPVVRAIKELLERFEVSVVGKKIAVVGYGKLVGQPAALWLTSEGAEVSIINKTTADRAALLQEAEIIISGVCEPGIITPDQIKSGAIVFDVGTGESNNKLVGDVDPACAQKCALFTPVPGGIGPLTVAMLFKNLYDLSNE